MTEPTPNSLEQQLAALRSDIDAIDDQILVLLNQRAELAVRVGELKSQHRQCHYAPKREREIIARMLQTNPGPFPPEGVRAVYTEIISASRSLERVLTIAYLGPPATYSHHAALRRFGRLSNYAPYQQLREVFEAVAKGDADYGIVAIENSTEGVVNSTLDLFIEVPVKICAETYIDVTHCLLSRGSLDQIEVVYSHPQALAQCQNWLRHTLPRARIEALSSTARGVERAREEPHAAAIGGEFAAEYYDIPILARSIQDRPGNTTRFVVIGHDENPPSGNDKTSLVVYVRDRPGALYDALSPFREHHINLTHIHSRPSRDEPWQYTFYIDLHGHAQDPPVAAALAGLERASLFVKLLGSYPRESR